MLKRRTPVLILIVISSLLLYSCRKETTPPALPPTSIIPPPDFGFKVVGYLPSYRDPAAIPDVKFRMCNVINYAFATVLSDGDVLLQQAARLVAVAARVKANNAKLLLSVNSTSGSFKTVSATSTQRNRFIKQLMDLLRAYKLDGIDMDWEYPSTADGTDISFTALMKELSDSCHTHGKYYLSAAITPGKYPGAVRDAVKTVVFNYVDWFNVMAYDDFNTVVPFKHHTDLALAEAAFNYWITHRGMPAGKFVLGFAGYGRPSGIAQGTTVLTYASILQKGGSPLSDSAVVMVPDQASPYTIYYNGQPTVKKKAMRAKERANGIMLWELGQDTNDATSLLKAACDTLGRIY